MFSISFLVDQAQTTKLRGVENLRFDDKKLLRLPLFSFLGLFSKRNRNIFFVFLSSYRNTLEGWAKPCSPKPQLVFL